LITDSGRIAGSDPDNQLFFLKRIHIPEEMVSPRIMQLGMHMYQPFRAQAFYLRGSVFYKQERLGQNGRHFMVYKFRTMVKDADERLKELEDMNEADGPAFKIGEGCP